jgi:hypothetical protein
MNTVDMPLYHLLELLPKHATPGRGVIGDADPLVPHDSRAPLTQEMQMSNAMTRLAASETPGEAAPATKQQTDEVDFGVQPTRSVQLPDPEPLLINLTHSVLEVLAGTRELDQLIRWLTKDVYDILLKRVVLSARARIATGKQVHRPRVTVLRTIITHPADGIVEAVVIVRTPVRTRAIAIRLEGLDNRWRASAISVL